jgi:hypothetical protein
MFIQTLRNIADNNKYTNWYISIVNKIKLRTEPIESYTEKHHILPKSIKSIINKSYDINNKNNILTVQPREHFILHLLLTKMFMSNKLFNKKMNYAFHQMKLTNKHQIHRYINSRFFDIIKREKPIYTRLYRGNIVKYIYPTDIDSIEVLLKSGYSYNMTDEYKVGRVGNMRGLKHTTKTKLKMSESAKKIVHYGLLNITPDQKKAAIKKGIETKRQRLIKEPHIYDESYKLVSKKLKELYKTGKLSNKGINNGRYGKFATESCKQKISEIHQRRTNSGYTHKETYFMYVKPALESGLTLAEIAINHPFYTGSKANKAYHLQQVIKKTIQQCEIIDCI